MENSISEKKRVNPNYCIYLCVFLACLVPRVNAFKIGLGISWSYYTIVVAIVWLVFVRRIYIIKQYEYYFFGIWAAFILFSVWRAEKIGNWFLYLDWILTAIFLQSIIIKLQDEETWGYIVRAITDALILHILMGLYEIISHTYLFETGNISRRLYGHVAVGMFHNLNDYATFVTTMIPIAIYRFINSKTRTEKMFCAFLIVASLYLIIISESRGVTFTLVAFIAVGLFQVCKIHHRLRYVIIGLIAVFLALIGFNAFGIKDAIYQLFTKSAINIENSASDLARYNLIRNGFYFLEKTFGFGVGAGNLYNWFAEKSIYYIGGLRFMHNWYMEILVTFGIVFFIVYCVFHIKLLYRLFTKKDGVNTLRITFFMSFVCFSIVSITSSSNMYSEWVWMYLVVLSMFSISSSKPDQNLLHN